MMSRITIRTQMLGALLVSLLPVVSLITYHIHGDLADAQANVAQTATTIAQVNAAEISRILNVTETFLQKLSENPEIRALDPKRCGHLFDHFPEISPHHANLLTKDISGQPICSALPIPPGNRINIKIYFDEAHHSQGIAIGDAYLGPLSKRWVVPIDFPLRNDAGQIIGTVSAPLDLMNFNPFVGAGAFDGLPEGTTATLFAPDMTMLARSKEPEKWIGSRRMQNPELAELLARGSGTTRFVSQIDNVERIHAAAPVQGTPWVTVASIPSAPLDAMVDNLVRKWIGAGLITAAASLALAYALAGQTSKPVLSIASVSEQVRAGNIQARAVPAGSVETVDLAEAFNTMLDSLQEQQRDCALSEDRYRSLFSRSKVVMLLIDPGSGVIVNANQAAEAYYGWPVDSLKGMPISQINCLPAEDIADAMARAKDERCSHFHFRHRLRCGETRDVEIHSGPVALDDRTLLLSVIHDETERLRLEGERQQTERTVERERLRLETILKTASDGIHILDPDGVLIEANDAFLTMLGYDRSAIGRLRVVDWDDAAPWEVIKRRNDALIARRGKEVFETRHRRRDGVILDVEINASGIEIEGQGYLYAASRDITERKQLEQQLRIAATVFESQEGMIVTDADSVILRVNRAFSEITGYLADEVVGRKTSILKSGRHDSAFYASIWNQIRDHGAWQGEIWNRRKNGNVYPQWLSITAVRRGTGEISHYVATLSDITLRKEAEDEIKHLAFYDPLTRLPNRRLLLDRLHQALASAKRSKREGALLFIDLDNFKTLNDTLGHDVGDILLQQVAQRIVTCIREGDTVARLGGDEFVVMLEDLSENLRDAAGQTEIVAEKILTTLNQPYLLAGQDRHSTPSIGATLFQDHQLSVEELLKRADLAMYQAKAAGRNTLRFFDPEMQASVSARAALEADLRKGLQDGQFLLHFQPQVDSGLGLIGAEVLCRWQHPLRGMVSPAEFIPVAEDTGLILPLGAWVLETACRQLRLWANQPRTGKLSLAVNVSARQFRQADFVEQVCAALDRTGADPRRLKLEITESLLLTGVQDVIAKMTALKAQGVGFSLDDFGTGYSSLSYLKRLPLDQLKIDQSFVRDVLIDINDGAIAQTIIALGQTMGLAVIAEGVETEDQRDFLFRLGCHAYQGYFFSRPLPLADFESYAVNR